MKKPTNLYDFGKLIESKKKYKNWIEVREALKETIEKFSLTETDIYFIELGFNGDNISGSEPLMPFGQHKNNPLDKVPQKYLKWCAQQEWISDWPILYQYLKENNYV
jgi:hypothetical protein